MASPTKPGVLTLSVDSVYSKCIAFTYSIGDIGIRENRIAFGGASTIRVRKVRQ